jgi:hypothetical protein
VEPESASPSCPRCGAECPGASARCRRCGFAFVDAAEGRGLARPGGRAHGVRRRGAHAAALVLATTAAAAAVAALLTIGEDDAPPAAAPVPVLPPPPSPVSAPEAERRLELRFGRASDDETAAVRCPRRIEPSRTVRCELRYSASASRPILVRISSLGELDATVPDVATLKR